MIRVTLGAWMVIVAVVCGGAAVVIHVVVPYMGLTEDRDKEAIIPDLRVHIRDMCVTDLRRIDEGWPPVAITNRACPMATGTNNTFVNSYDLGNTSTPPTCRIRPEEHVLP